MSSTTPLAIPTGSLVVVTGANGFIASHVVDQLLQQGYHVRGTVRNAAKSSWLNSYFSAKYGSGRFSLAEVPDMSHEGAFDEVVKGAAGIAHVATPVMQFYDPNIAVPMAVNGTVNILAAAAAEPTVRRVVITSSSTAAASPQPNKVFTMDEKTWNETAVKAAWAPPPYEGSQRLLDVYSASKTQAEQAAWTFMEDHKPDFVLNTVLPNVNMGTILSPEHQGYPSTDGWIKAVWDGFPGEEGQALKYNPPQYYINVQDAARVHVAALIYPDVQNERLFAFAHPYSWNDILAILRRLYPQQTFIDDIPNLGEDKSIVANQRAEELLKRMSGLSAWTSLEQSVQDATTAWV
ncbi:aldehyde reductase II [Aspergillus bombycis]|uniref:Aldehyde reductase II n=1 Tax=Aspergillus bombycis TaxID=109264 RepID=A0A1F7ZUK2_9EURO|nr:aldehyde reductase II [Aspergillus bombycis]OGM42959.1 aldehyde reductase II [Aspergillus bombycis]